VIENYAWMTDLYVLEGTGLEETREKSRNTPSSAWPAAGR
jgi:hypothetical protein